MTQLDLFPIAKSSQQDTPVNPSPLPGTVKAQKMTATSGKYIMQIVTCKRPLVRFRKCWWSHLIGSRQVLSDLEAEDYSTRTFIIPACIDAPHKRDRVWIVAQHRQHRTTRSSEEANGEDNGTTGR